jgi:hypothetical protein
VIALRPLLRALCAAALLLPAPCRTAPAGEYQVKAVYLFNFSGFVQWPQTAFDSPDSPFIIGILGSDPFGETIDAVVRGESLNGRPLQVRRFKTVDEVTDCNILFIGRQESARLEDTLEALRGRSVLTVTDIDGAEHHGAMIVLFNRDNRIRMRINLAAARAGNLVISSKLLRPAEVVGAEVP